MKQKKSTEDYLKTIYILHHTDGVRGAEIAEVMNVSRPTVSVALKALEQEGYVWMNEHRLVFLTELGLNVASETYEKNCFFRNLLLELGIDDATATRDACELEHSVSTESFFAIRSALAHRKGGNG